MKQEKQEAEDHIVYEETIVQEDLNDEDEDQSLESKIEQESYSEAQNDYHPKFHQHTNLLKVFKSLYDRQNQSQPLLSEIKQWVSSIKSLFPSLSLTLVAQRLLNFIQRQKQLCPDLFVDNSEKEEKRLKEISEKLLILLEKPVWKYSDIKAITGDSRKSAIREDSELKPVYRVESDEKLRTFITNKGMIMPKPTYYSRFKLIRSMCDYKLLEREIAAEAFCQRGYGIPKLRQQLFQLRLNLSIDDKRYKAVSCAFATEGFRKLERFLIKDCRKRFKFFNACEVKVIYTILLNCKQIFSDKQAATFIKYLQLAYELYQVQIDEQESLWLYNKVVSTYRSKLRFARLNTDSRMTPFKQNQLLKTENKRLGLDSVWTRQRNLQFYDQFIKEQSIGKMRDNYRRKYGNLENAENKQLPTYIEGKASRMKVSHIHFTTDDDLDFFRIVSNFKYLNSKYHKEIRRGLRKIQYYVRNNSDKVPKLKHVNDDVVKSMFGSPDAAKIRLKMMHMHKFDELNVEIVTDLVQQINKFTQLREEVRRKHEKELDDGDLLDF